MTAYGYCRVSTDKQAEDGESLGVQERAIQGYCMMQGLGNPVIFVERGISASIPMCQRPEGAKLLATIKPGDVFISAKFDRAFRSALDALTIRDDFKARGILLTFIDIGEVTQGGPGNMFFMIMGALAEGEREKLIDRVTEVKADQKARGRYLGGSIPFGYDLGEGGALVANPGQQSALRKARELKARDISIRAISRELRADGHDISHVSLGKYL